MTSIKSDQSFDEDAYLAGQIPLNVDPVEKPKPKRAGKLVCQLYTQHNVDNHIIL